MQALFLLMTVILVVPVLLILVVLVQRGGPVISWSFLTTAPTNGMTEGGIFPALVGTIWLVCVALVISVPIGWPRRSTSASTLPTTGSPA